MIIESINLQHPFDIQRTTNDDLELFAEELPEQVQLLSDCLSSLACGSCCTTTASVSSVGSITSCGG